MTQYILITGGAGYIGSHVAHALAQSGYTPIILDDLSQGHRFAVDNSWPFYEADIADKNVLAKIIKKHQPKSLMHFAAKSDVAESIRAPENYWQTNVSKADELFACGIEAGIENIIFSSTAAVYGAPPAGMKLDEEAPLNPINPYGKSKMAAEQSLQKITCKKANIAILRYFNAAGAAHGIGEAHWPETHLIPRAIQAALGYMPPIQLFGDDYETPDGTAIRDYVHVADIARAHIQALEYVLNNKQNLICNLGSGRGYSVKEIILALAELLENDVPHVYAPRREGDPATLVADICRAKEILDWQPEHGLERILQDALNWHKSPIYKDFIVGRFNAP